MAEATNTYGPKDKQPKWQVKPFNFSAVKKIGQDKTTTRTEPKVVKQEVRREDPVVNDPVPVTDEPKLGMGDLKQAEADSNINFFDQPRPRNINDLYQNPQDNTRAPVYDYKKLEDKPITKKVYKERINNPENREPTFPISQPIETESGSYEAKDIEPELQAQEIIQKTEILNKINSGEINLPPFVSSLPVDMQLSYVGATYNNNPLYTSLSTLMEPLLHLDNLVRSGMNKAFDTDYKMLTPPNMSGEDEDDKLITGGTELLTALIPLGASIKGANYLLQGIKNPFIKKILGTGLGFVINSQPALLDNLQQGNMELKDYAIQSATDFVTGLTFGAMPHGTPLKYDLPYQTIVPTMVPVISDLIQGKEINEKELINGFLSNMVLGLIMSGQLPKNTKVKEVTRQVETELNKYDESQKTPELVNEIIAGLLPPAREQNAETISRVKPGETKQIPNEKSRLDKLLRRNPGTETVTTKPTIEQVTVPGDRSRIVVDEQGTAKVEPEAEQQGYLAPIKLTAEQYADMKRNGLTAEQIKEAQDNLNNVKPIYKKTESVRTEDGQDNKIIPEAKPEPEPVKQEPEREYETVTLEREDFGKKFVVDSKGNKFIVKAEKDNRGIEFYNIYRKGPSDPAPVKLGKYLGRAAINIGLRAHAEGDMKLVDRPKLKQEAPEVKKEEVSDQEKKYTKAYDDMLDLRDEVNNVKSSDLSGRANKSKNIALLKKAVDIYNGNHPDNNAKIERTKYGTYNITINGKPLRRESVKREFDPETEANNIDNPNATKSFKELGAEEREVQRKIAENISGADPKFVKEKFKFETPMKVLRKGLEDIKEDSGKEQSAEAKIVREEMLEKTDNGAEYRAEKKDAQDNEKTDFEKMSLSELESYINNKVKETGSRADYLRSDEYKNQIKPVHDRLLDQRKGKIVSKVKDVKTQLKNKEITKQQYSLEMEKVKHEMQTRDEKLEVKQPEKKVNKPVFDEIESEAKIPEEWIVQQEPESYSKTGFAYRVYNKKTNESLGIGAETYEGAIERFKETPEGQLSKNTPELIEHKTTGPAPSEKKTVVKEEIKKTEPEKKVTENIIEDFGEKLGGAKKDYAEKLSDAKELDIATNPFSKVFPEPEYDKLIDKGVDPRMVALVRSIRDEIPAKPKASYKISRWVGQVKLLRDMAEKFLSGDYTFDDISLNMEARNLKAILDRAELYQNIGHAQNLSDYVIHSRMYETYNGVKFDKPTEMWDISKKQGKYGLLSRIVDGKTKEEAIANFKKEIGKLKAEEKSKGTKFEFYRTNDNKIGIGKQTGRNVTIFKKFDTMAEAKEYKNNNAAELESLYEKSKYVAEERREQNRERKGEKWRDGKDITPEEFYNTFNFRGVEFGNWVGKKGERQDLLNETYDGLKDLAKALNIPDSAISLNGTLGLGFGSRGKGGKSSAAAHFEPGKVIINLTRMHGKGSLAHEWLHALDNYFSRIEEDKTGYLSDKSGAKNVRKEVYDAWNNVLEALKTKTEIFERSGNLDRARSNPYWRTKIEVMARSFESYLIDHLESKGTTNDFLSNVKNKVDFTSDMVTNWMAGMTEGDPVPRLNLYHTQGKIGVGAKVGREVKIFKTFNTVDTAKKYLKENEAEFKAELETILKNTDIPKKKELTAEDMYPYLLDAEVKAVKPAFDNLFKSLKTEEVKRDLPAREKFVSDESYKQAIKNFNQITHKIYSNPVEWYAKRAKDISTIGLYHLESGLTKFGDWAKRMVKELGDKVKPHLKKIWAEINNPKNVKAFRKNNPEAELHTSGPSMKLKDKDGQPENFEQYKKRIAKEYGTVPTREEYNDAKQLRVTSDELRNKEGQDKVKKEVEDVLDKVINAPAKEKTLDELRSRTSKRKKNAPANEVYMDKVYAKMNEIQADMEKRGYKGQSLMNQSEIQSIKHLFSNDPEFKKFKAEQKRAIVREVKNYYKEEYRKRTAANAVLGEEYTDKNWWQNLKNSSFLQSRNHLARQGPSGKEMAERFKHMADQERELMGEPSGLLLDIEGLSKAEKNNLEKIWEQKMNEQIPMNYLNDNVKNLDAKIDDYFENMANMYKERGFVTRNLLTGDVYAFTPKRDYRPRIMNDKVSELEVKEDSSGIPKENKSREKVIDFLIETKQAKDRAGAAILLDNELSKHRIRKAGNVEYSRNEKLRLPDEYYVKNPTESLLAYAKKVSKRVSFVDAWGMEGQIFNRLRDDLYKEGKDYKRANDLFRYETGQLTADERKLIYRVNNVKAFMALTKFSPFTSLRNAFQGFLGTTTRGNLKAGFSGLVKSLDPVMKKHAYEAGVMADNLEGIFKDTIGANNNNFLGNLTTKYLDLIKFTATDRYNRVISAVGGLSFMEDMLKRIKKDSVWKKRAAREFKKLEIDPDKVIENGGFTKAEKDKIMRTFAFDSQFSLRPQDLPLWWSSPQGKLVTQWKPWGYKMTQLIRDNVIAEVKHGNVMPLVTMMTAYGVTGEAVNYLIDNIRSVANFNPKEDDKKNETPDEKSFIGKINQGDIGGAFERAVSDLAGLGALSLYWDIIRSFGYGKVGEGLSVLAGPAYAEAGGIIENVLGPGLKKLSFKSNDDWEEVTKKTIKGLYKSTAGNVPGAGTFRTFGMTKAFEDFLFKNDGPEFKDDSIIGEYYKGLDDPGKEEVKKIKEMEKDLKTFREKVLSNPTKEMQREFQRKESEIKRYKDKSRVWYNYTKLKSTKEKEESKKLGK